MKFIYPPRPKNKLPPSNLPRQEAKGGWLWQPKYDGSRSPVAIENGRVEIFNRYDQKRSDSKYQIIARELLELNVGNGLCYLDGELIDSHGLRLLVLFDVLQMGGEYLLGVNQTDRLSHLAEICGNPQQRRDDLPALHIFEHIALAPHGDRNFKQCFDEFSQNRWVEGLLLRKKESKLDNWGSTEYEVNWQIRVRRPKKSYRC